MNLPGPREGAFQLKLSRVRGGLFRLTTSQILQTTPERAFSFFSNPYNLAYLAPPWLEFRLLEDGGGLVSKGVEFRYTMKWLGVRMPWRSRVVSSHPPGDFTEIQAIGPFRIWVHLHTFGQAPEGTLVKDRVDYRLPLGMAGRMVHIWIVERQLREIFTYRAARLEEAVRRGTL